MSSIKKNKTIVLKHYKTQININFLLDNSNIVLFKHKLIQSMIKLCRYMNNDSVNYIMNYEHLISDKLQIS